MAIKFETLKNYMPEIGLTNFKDEPGKTEFEGALIAGLTLVTGDDEYKDFSIIVVLNLEESGEFLQVRFMRFIKKETVKISPYKAELLVYLSQENYKRKIGRWCLDPEDGDVYVDWAIGIEDNDKLTLNQVLRIISALTKTAKDAWPAINRILKTGSEVNTEELKKDILLLLVNAKQFKLIEKIGPVGSTETLEKVKKLAELKKFDEIEKILDEIKEIPATM